MPHLEATFIEDNAMNRLSKTAATALLLALLPAFAAADEALQQIEEVVVTGAVSSTVKVADIDLPDDANIPEMTVAYE